MKKFLMSVQRVTPNRAQRSLCEDVSELSKPGFFLIVNSCYFISVLRMKIKKASIRYCRRNPHSVSVFDCVCFSLEQKLVFSGVFLFRNTFFSAMTFLRTKKLPKLTISI